MADLILCLDNCSLDYAVELAVGSVKASGYDPVEAIRKTKEEIDNSN